MTFDDIDLCTVAPVKVVDIAVGQVKQNVITSPRPLRPGQTYVRATYASRVISVQFALLISTAIEREEALQAIRAWAHPGTPGELTVDSRPGQAITAVCTGLPEASMRQWWEDKLKVTFTAYEPLFYDQAERTAASGVSVYVIGNAPPQAYLTASVSEGNQTLTITDGTRTMTLKGQMSEGEVHVDLEHQTVRHSVDGDLSALLTLTSRYPEVHAGENTITGATLHYRPRWL